MTVIIWNFLYNWIQTLQEFARLDLGGKVNQDFCEI